ncbi:MAG: hypothetical protein K2H53_05460 [Clostridia bacterium]|nr:hypothetical protein [Clostridia bacterium]
MHGSYIANEENSISQVISVDAYKDSFYAVDENGIAYTWKVGGTPTKIDITQKIIKVDGTLLLRRRWKSI